MYEHVNKGIKKRAYGNQKKVNLTGESTPDKVPEEAYYVRPECSNKHEKPFPGVLSLLFLDC
jgi:hypothetical protein